MKFTDMLQVAEEEKQVTVAEIAGLQMQTEGFQQGVNELQAHVDNLITMLEIGNAITEVGVNTINVVMGSAINGTLENAKIREPLHPDEEMDKAFNEQLEPVLTELTAEVQRELNSLHIAKRNLKEAKQKLAEKEKTLEKQLMMIELAAKADTLCKRGYKLYKLNRTVHVVKQEVAKQEAEEAKIKEVQATGGNN